MVNKGPRESDHENAYTRQYEAELAKNPPILIWEPKPGNPWIRIAVFIQDYVGKPGRRPTPPCICKDLFGSPKRRRGHHHDAECARSKPW